MGIKDIIDRFKKDDTVYEELKEQDRAMSKLQERKLSANERELNKIIKQRREEQIKNELNKIHKQEQKDFWKKDVISQKNIFVGHKNLFKNRGSI